MPVSKIFINRMFEYIKNRISDRYKLYQLKCIVDDAHQYEHAVLDTTNEWFRAKKYTSHLDEKYEEASMDYKYGRSLSYIDLRAISSVKHTFGKI